MGRAGPGVPILDEIAPQNGVLKTPSSVRRARSLGRGQFDHQVMLMGESGKTRLALESSILRGASLFFVWGGETIKGRQPKTGTGKGMWSSYVG